MVAGLVCLWLSVVRGRQRRLLEWEDGLCPLADATIGLAFGALWDHGTGRFLEGGLSTVGDKSARKLDPVHEVRQSRMRWASDRVSFSGTRSVL